MAKTVSEIAKELEVSRQAVHQAIDKSLDKEKLNKKGNAFILNAEEQRIIRDSFNNKENKSSSKNGQDLTTLLDGYLIKENEYLKKTIDSKDQQIEQLHILLLNSQNENMKLLENKNKKNKEKIIDSPKQKKWYEFWKW